MTKPASALEMRLRHRRALGFAALLFERVWVALWPVLGVVGLYACLALLDLPRRLPPLGECALLAAFAAAAAVLLWRGLAALRPPDPAAVDRRLERDSGLKHRPLAALTDEPVADDPMGAALWRVHLARSAEQIERLRVGWPHPGLARIDRHALRGGLVVALAACIGIAGADAPERLWAAVTPTLPRGAAAPATELQAWITPPDYTGIAPIFLKPGPEDAMSLRVPTGSKLVVSVTGGEGAAPRLDLAGADTGFHTLSAGSFQADSVLTQGGTLIVRRGSDALARWRIEVVPNTPPTVAWSGPPGPARAELHTALPWKTSDQYGVTRLSAELLLKARPSAPPLIVPIPVPGDGKTAQGRAAPDLSANPWAGLPVIARLVGRDAAGLQGVSADATLMLPERHFTNPQAKALIEVRKKLSLDPDARDDALASLDDLLVSPGTIGKDPTAYVTLSAIYYLLEFDRTPKAVPEAQAMMWDLALRLEEGAAARTDRALQAAMRAARDALAAMKATPDEQHRRALEQAMRALEQAIARHMQALARQYGKDGLPPMAMPQMGRQMNQQDLQRMAQQALQAAQQGQTQQAEQDLSRLEQMLDALRQARPMTAQQRAQQQQAEQQMQKARQDMGAVGDLLHREAGLLDHVQQRQQEARTIDPPGAEPRSRAAQRKQDAAVQQALRRALGEVMQQVGDMTGKIPQGLGDADQQMQGAAGALLSGNDRLAQQSEMKAIEDLQKGGQQASQQMAQKMGGQGSGQGQGQGTTFMTGSQPGGQGDDGTESPFGQSAGSERGSDPLGRRTGEGGQGYDEGSDLALGHEGPKKTEQIQQELRRRDAQRSRPPEEHEYIERLLRQF